MIKVLTKDTGNAGETKLSMQIHTRKGKSNRVAADTGKSVYDDVASASLRDMSRNGLRRHGVPANCAHQTRSASVTSAPFQSDCKTHPRPAISPRRIGKTGHSDGARND